MSWLQAVLGSCLYSSRSENFKLSSNTKIEMYVSQVLCRFVEPCLHSVWQAIRTNAESN
jgi:hypothetical protein